MDHDIGWAAREITLSSGEVDGHSEQLTLPCRWVEYVQTWDGTTAPPFFLVSVDRSDRLDTGNWCLLAFKDGSGKAHRYAVSGVVEISPLKVRLTRVVG